MADDRGFRVQIKFDGESESFRAVVAELGLSATGASRSAALEAMEAAIEDHIAAVAAEGGHLPEPSDLVTKGTSPKLELQLASPLYRDLAYQASLDGITPEELAKALLAYAIGALEGRDGGARRGRAEAPNRGATRREDQRDERGNQRDDRGNQRDDRGGARRDDRGGPRRGREQYRPELDDKANFLEYLRNLEKGGGRGGRR